MKRFNILVGTMVLLLFLPNLVFSKDKFTVAVIIKPDNSNSYLPINSYLKKNLRSLGDVKISDIKPQFILIVEVIPINYEGDKTTQLYVLYAIIIENYESFPIFKNSAYFMTLPRNLEQHCRELVAGFDQSTLEPLR